MFGYFFGFRSVHLSLIISEFPPVASRRGQPRCWRGILARARAGSVAGQRRLAPCQSRRGRHRRDPHHSPAESARDRRRWASQTRVRHTLTDGAGAQLDSPVREGLIGDATRHHHGTAWMGTGQHVSDLRVERRSVKSGAIDVGHAKQAQEPALELAQLGFEDHGPSSPPNAERVPLHVVKQVNQAAGRGTTTLAALGVQRQAFNAEIRGRKIGDIFPDQSSISPVFFPGSSGWLSLVFPLI